ncbi:MAG: ATP-binding protein, partial [Chloroflexi bacterium]|nr:ATP-binding protein [Chloroflexota bacterium]
MRGVAVGRDNEVEDGWRQLAAARDAGLVAVLIDGEPGIGKSALWAAITDKATSLGMRALIANPAETETAVSYAGLGDLLREIDDDDM